MQFIWMLFNRYGLLIVFVLTVLEYACFPLPSEVVLPFMGYIVSSGSYSLFGTILMSVLMGYLGSLVCYLIGYYGGSKIYNIIYNTKPSWRKGLDCSHNFFNKYGNISVFVGRVIPMCRTYVSFFAGMFKQSLFKYSTYSILGITIWNSLLIAVGYYLADNFILVKKYYDNYKFCFIGIFITALLFFVYNMYKRRKKTKTINGD